jgi:ATPase subunit of ABC transporter with duplicated ATPase domains
LTAIDSVGQLAAALRGYRGALLVASHDRRFLDDLQVQRYRQLEEIGLPRELDVPA